MATCQFILKGVLRTLSTEEVEEALMDVEPEPIQQLAVGVHGKWFPVKQAFGLSISAPHSAFNAHTAVRAFSKLEFRIHDIKKDGRLPPVPGGRFDVADTALRLKVLELAVALSTGQSASDAMACAENFLVWVTSHSKKIHGASFSER